MKTSSDKVSYIAIAIGRTDAPKTGAYLAGL